MKLNKLVRSLAFSCLVAGALVARVGSFILKSELGKGSTFLLKFPKRLILSEPGGAL